MNEGVLVFVDCHVPDSKSGESLCPITPPVFIKAGRNIWVRKNDIFGIQVSLSHTVNMYGFRQDHTTTREFPSWRVHKIAIDRTGEIRFYVYDADKVEYVRIFLSNITKVTSVGKHEYGLVTPSCRTIEFTIQNFICDHSLQSEGKLHLKIEEKLWFEFIQKHMHLDFARRYLLEELL